MKDNTENKKSSVEKRTKWVIEQMFSDHKKLRNEEKHFIKNHETLFTLKSSFATKKINVVSIQDKKTRNLIYYSFLKTVMSFIA